MEDEEGNLTVSEEKAIISNYLRFMVPVTLTAGL